MNNKIKIWVAVIVIAIIAVAGCLTDEKSLQEDNQTKENVVTIRYLSSSAVVEPYEFAHELGYFRGITINRLGSTTGGPEDIMSVATGRSDVGHSAWVPIINAKVRGAEIKAVAGPMGKSPGSW